MEYIAQEVLLKEGVRLDATWERHKAADAPVIVADGVAVVMSLELTQEIADAALALEPEGRRLPRGRVRRSGCGQGQHLHQRQERQHRDEDGLMGVPIKFDPNQGFQRDAIDAVLELFAGQEAAEQGFADDTFATEEMLEGFTELVFGNTLSLAPETMRRNLRGVQDSPVTDMEGEERPAIPEAHAHRPRVGRGA